MQGQRRDKGEDKPVAGAHREYLDEEFSSEDEAPEEKRERRGGRRAQDDQFSGNLLRATYAEKELDKLVNYVKDFTTLSGLSEEYWNHDCLEVVREFIVNTGAPILILFFDNDSKLAARLSVPNEPVHELTYFSRKPNQVFHPDQFPDQVLFGTINDNVEVSILTLVRDVIFPMSEKISESWSGSVKEDFRSSVERFLCNLTDLTYKMLGLSVIYQPREGSELSSEAASFDKKLVKRLEQIVVHWTRQIRIALADQDQSNAGELLSFKDEYDFWIYRYENLLGLRQQLGMSSARRVLQVLAEARSGQVRRVQALAEETERAIREALSNLQLLGVMEGPCSELLSLGLDNYEAELLPRLARLLQLCRVVWLNSAYFGEPKRVGRLFELLGNQIIACCRAAIPLEQLFAGNTSRTIQLLRDSIGLCRHYQRLYDQISRAHNKLTHHEWQLNADQVFQYINVFVVRCQNLIEISQAIIDFARVRQEHEVDELAIRQQAFKATLLSRMDEGRAAPAMKLSGSRGAEYEKSWAKIEDRFGQLLRWLSSVSWKILNVRQSTWYDDMSHFRCELHKLEVAVANVMDRALQESANLEEAVRVLHGFRHLARRDNLGRRIEEKVAWLWRLFDEELETTKRQLTDERDEYPALGTYWAGRALALRLKTSRLAGLAELLREREEQEGAEGLRQCQLLLDSLKVRGAELHRGWLAEIGDNPQARLDRHLMRRLGQSQRAGGGGSLQCNIQPRLVSLCEEAAHWQSMRFELPVDVQQINARWSSLHFIYENVLAIVRAYNNILRALSDEEKLLFRELIRELDRKINPGLTKLTWNSDYIEDYIKDCNTHTANLQEFVDTYKRCNADILKICSSLCDTSMIKIRAHHVYQLDELLEEMEITRQETIKIYTNKYKEIIQYLLVVYEGFQRVIEDSLKQWKFYLMKFDRLLQESLKIAMKNSLSAFYGALHGDGTTAPIPVIHLKADLIDNKIHFCPALADVARMVSETLYRVIDSLKIVPRIVEKFQLQDLETKPFWKEYMEDNDLDRSQQMLNNEVSYCFSQVQNYLTTWEPFADIWEINKDLFIQRYEKLKPTVTLFDADIGRYAEVANNVQMQETVVSVHFLEINAEQLKAAIGEQCGLWQRKLTELLLRMTESQVHHIYKNVADNGKRITKEPSDLISMQAALQLFERLTTEIPREEKEFSKIRQQYETLEKYEIPMTLELKRNIRDIDECWAAYLKSLASWKLVLNDKKEALKQKLIEEDEQLKNNISGMLEKFRTNAPFTDEWNTKSARNWMRSFRKKVNAVKAKMNKLKKDLSIFSISQLESDELNILLKDLGAIELVWELAAEWDYAWEHYKAGNFWSIEIEEMDETANVLFRKLTRLSRELKEKQWSIVDATRSRVDKFRRTLPLITDLKNPCMRDRHWRKVMQTIGREFDPNSDEFTLNAIAEMQMHSFAEEIADTSNAATMELAIETGLKNIARVWKEMPLEMAPYKDKGVFRLTTIDDITQALEEHQVQLSAMKSTKFVEAFAVEVDYWERALSSVGEILEMVLSVQKGYMYLDNIFGAEDIRRQLPRETREFDQLTVSWREITGRMTSAALALDATHKPPGLFNTLNKLNNKLEAIQRELEEYLETKRHVFPRFYFISNDDLLEILANSKKPELVQPHIKKLFENIKHIKLGRSASGKPFAEGMFSGEGEYVEFLQPIILEGQVEVWLCYIESAMRECLREVLRQCRAALRKMSAKRDKWVKEWQSQPGITSTQMQWTSDCTRILLQCKLAQSKKPLKKLKHRQNQALAKYSEAVRANLDRLQRLKFKAIVVIEIHARDVIDTMYRANCRDVTAFEWLSQLRFYWDRDIDDCIVRQTNTSFVYGYEYLGNSERLVITPLTDRCYITLTTALHLHRGGSPKGPAGTGKTETTKDLGKALGFNVIVVNCSEGLDYKSMGRMFAGLAQTGAWGCFDEFNRINIEVLSVVAQQILSILTALSQKATRFIFEGVDISLVHTCGIFITMNPGYAGRTELPDNLKSMFRPISMMVPDSSMIAEINLFGEGFQNSRSLAKKVDTLYSLAKQQLSKQFHYDFGLRGIVTLTRYAGKKRRLYPNLPDEEVVILAMNDMNIAKLTSDDLPLFIGITSDLFPGIQVPSVDYGEFTRYIIDEAIKLKLQPIPGFIRKVIELYETKNSRHSTMIVGQSNTGKTATWRTLQNTLTTMKKDGKSGFNIVHEFPINPKALNLGELYGEYNLSTGEWSDGVISSIMRKTCADETPAEKWIVFDGPVDAVWIENMNSVMDDNKILTLINNDRITLPEQVSLLFEVEDLAVASPATVSRAGMVYTDYKDIGWRPFVDSWLQKYEKQPEFVEEMNKCFNKYVNRVLEFKRTNCNELVAVPEPNAVQSLCKLLEILATPQNGVELLDSRDAFNSMCLLWFLFCMIWSLCASVDEEGRQKMDNFVREMEGSSFPLRDTIYEYCVDARQRSFASWEEKLSPTWKFPAETDFYKIIVPTVDTIRYEYLVNVLLTHGFPVLLVGPVGTGKTSTAQSVLNSLDQLKYSSFILNMSGQTSSKNVQDAIEGRVEKRTKGVFVPIGGKIMITYMDDFNMPAKDTYGSQPPLELIRQWMGYGFWYDRLNQALKCIQKMQLMTSMGPPGGGRNAISNRLLAKFNVINMTFPAEKQIVRIFGTMLNQQLLDFHEEVKGLADDITRATIGMYNNVVVNMLPTPMKMHYLFNLRDISKVFQGLLRSHKDYQYSKETFLRLWVHETCRVFSDRLVDEQDKEWFASAVNEQLGQHFDTTFSGLCPEKRCPVFGSFMNAWNIYEELKDVAAVRSYAESQMDEHNSTAGVVRLDLILFRDALEHICRIVRVISEPRGNMLLVGIGGSGRQSLSRLAAYMCELTTFQVEVSKHYHVVEFREDLKSLYYLAGVDNKASSFLFNDTQIVEEQFLEIVNNMLSTGEIASLFKPDELEDIKNKLSKEAAKARISPTMEAIYLFLIQRVRANLHVILCMSPIGEAFRNRLRQYPALINCTTIDWFHEWPREALLEVGNKFLMNLDFTLTITGDKRAEREDDLPPALLQEQTRNAIASSFSLIHASVSQFSQRMIAEMKRYNYVTPTNFLELVAGYKQMLEDKRAELSGQANKLRNGLYKLDDTKEKVKEMAVELVVTQQQVQRSTIECEEYLVSIVSQRRDADDTQKLVTARSLKIAEESVECKRLEAIARADLASVEPALEEAMMALDALNKKDLTEIKSFTRPPAKVQMVMEAVMILKCSEPSWAESKRQLGDVNFINQLRDFDKDHMTDKTLRLIAKYTSMSDFDPEKVGVVSNAAKSLCMWVIAMEQYGKLFRIVAPKRANLEAALLSLREKEAALTEARAQLQKLREQLERLQQMYDAKMKEKEDLISLEELLKLKLERAAMLVDGLSGERVRWESSVEELGGMFDSLPGDCLIATGFVSYLGPFVSNYREELARIWSAQVLEKEIPSSRSLDVKEFLSNPTTIREWNIQGLPSDDFSTENGIIIVRGSRWPLVIDPQGQAAKWIKYMEAKNSLKIIDFAQTDFTKILEQAIQFGKPVLLQNVGETLEPVMDSVLQKAFIKTGNQLMIKFNDKMITFNEKFRLFITTKLPNPHYAPEISTKTTLCNFAIKEQGLEAQLLGIVVRKEKPQLEEQKDNLVLTIATGKRTLKELEDKILYLLSVSSGSLLDDLDLLTTLQTSKSTAITVAESLVVSEETEIEIDKAREAYRACSKRAALLFFVLNDMSRIDPMYQFSLDAYISLFNISIDKSPLHPNLAERIDALNDYHTYALYRNTCRGLFEHHKLLFSFHMCMRILEAQDKVVQSEYAFLLSGGIVIDRESQPEKPVAWLPDESWDNVTELDKFPGFHGLIVSFEQFPRDWQNWFMSSEPESEELVAEWEERCNEFQRMLIIRSGRPDRMTSCLRSFIVANLGQPFVEPPVLDVKAVLDDSTERTPLIFVLSAGVDPTTALLQLADNQDMGHRFMTLSLGQGQAPIATRMIELGSRQGAWVFLANCHLSLSWMPKLDKIVENLASDKDVHPQFRLWLSSSPTPQFPISILQAGMKMTTEPPKGLKANMKRLYGLISESQFEICQSKAKYKKLLFALVFFHAVLLERKKFQQLGWNVVYSFNDSDFEVSENLLQVYLDEYEETPWDALKYLIAGICYGGHVTDDWDRRLLLSYVEDYMSVAALQVPQYRLSSLPTYYVPRDGSLDSYRDLINTLPMTDRPEAFGQHPNADITSLIMETRMTFETLMSMQTQAASGGGGGSTGDEGLSTEERVSQLAEDIESKLPKLIDVARAERSLGRSPLEVVLLQEAVRYNALLVAVRSSLQELRRAIAGLAVMSAELEETFSCVQEGRVPLGWSRAYASLKPLAAWTRDLGLRLEHFSQWAESGRPPARFWLAAFTFPTGFLTAVLQTQARRARLSIDSLSWEFAVFKPELEHSLNAPPENGVYIRSMYLEGAGWDAKLGALVDPAPMQLVCNMPVIHFKPTEQLRKKTKGLYNCPCYYYPQRSGDQGRPAYVVTVDLNAGAENAAFWTKRGTALLLSLAS